MVILKLFKHARVSAFQKTHHHPSPRAGFPEKMQVFSMTPTARTLKLLRAAGYLCERVEQWVPVAGVRRDLFNFGDVLAIHPTRREVVIVQCTSLSNLPTRVAKIGSIPVVPALLAAGVMIQAHGWALRAGRWECKVIEIRPEDARPVVKCRMPRRRGGRRWEPAPLFK